MPFSFPLVDNLMPPLLYEQPPYGGLLRTTARIRAVRGCLFLTAAGGLLRSPVNVAAYLLKNVAAHSNSIHAPAFCGGIDKYSPALSDCKFATAQICPLQGRNPRSINRRFVRRVYFALKRRGLREGLAPSPEITRRHFPGLLRSCLQNRSFQDIKMPPA